MTRVKLTESEYLDLRITARRLVSRERPGHALQPEALVHEAWLRLAGETVWRDPGHLRAAARRHMLHILIDHGRRLSTPKHGANLRVSLDEARNAPAPPQFGAPFGPCEAFDVLDRLRLIFPVAARVVELRVFVGMTDLEIASALRISPRTVRRQWSFARDWLRKNMGA